MSNEELTITEGLAEIKTVGKRLAKKRQFVSDYLFRQERMKDPFAKDGGSEAAINATLQSIGDLENRIVRIRGAVAAANAIATLTIDGDARTVQDWLVWRREVAPGQQSFLASLRQTLQSVRQDAAREGLRVVEGRPHLKSARHVSVLRLCAGQISQAQSSSLNFQLLNDQR